MDSAVRVLLTGFGAFGQRADNPTQQIVAAIQDTGIPGVEIHIAVLPVEFQGGVEAVLGHYRRLRPDVVICLGVAGGRKAITPEKVAINLAEAVIADNAGAQPHAEELVAGGPAAYFSALPVQAMVEAIKAESIPAQVSYSAGTYVCNAVMYAILHEIGHGREKVQGNPHRVVLSSPLAGFIHVPDSVDVPLEQSTQAVRRCVEIAADYVRRPRVDKQGSGRVS